MIKKNIKKFKLNPKRKKRHPWFNQLQQGVLTRKVQNELFHMDDIFLEWNGTSWDVKRRYD